MSQFLPKSWGWKNKIEGPPRLPDDVIVLVGGFLAGQFAFKTLGSLSRANRKIRQETRPILFETYIIKYTSSLSQVLPVLARKPRLNPCFEEVRYLIIEHVPPSVALETSSAEPAPAYPLPPLAPAPGIRGFASRMFPSPQHSSPEPQKGLAADISKFFPSLELAIISREEKVNLDGIEVSPCDVSVLGSGVTVSQLQAAMITSINTFEYVYDRPFDLTEHASVKKKSRRPRKTDHSVQAVRDLVLRKDTAVVETPITEQEDKAYLARMVIPDHFRIRITQMPGWRPRGDPQGWIENLRDSMNSFEAVRERMTIPRTVVVCSWICLQGLMEIAGSLPANYCVKFILHGDMDFAEEALFPEEWQSGVGQYILARQEQLPRRPANDIGDDIQTNIARSRDQHTQASLSVPNARDLVTSSYQFEAQFEIPNFPFWRFVNFRDFPEIFYHSVVIFALERISGEDDRGGIALYWHIVWRNPDDGSEVARTLPEPIVESEWTSWILPAYMRQRGHGRPTGFQVPQPSWRRRLFHRLRLFHR